MNTIEFLQKGKNIRRIDSTTVEVTLPDGTKRRVLSEVPLKQTYPEFAALFASRLGSSLGVAGLPSLAYKLYKYYKNNLPLMYGEFDLGKKKSFFDTLNEPTPLPIRILDTLPFMKNGNKINVIEQFKNGRLIRRMQTAAGGPLVSESTKIEKPIVVIPKKISKSQLLDNNSWEKTDNNEVHVYPNLRNDKYVQEFFLYDYAPRFKRLNGFASQNYVNAALNIYKNTPINIYNEDSDTGGYQTGGIKSNYNNFMSRLVNPSYVPPSIYLNEKFKLNRPTLVHELTHAFRLGYLGITGDTKFSSEKRPLYNLFNGKIGNEYAGSGYSNSEKNILNNTYNMEGYDPGYDPLHEKGTTNTEVRFRLWKELYDKLGRRPSLEETDKYIKTYNGKKLLRMIKNANIYGETMYYNGMSTDLIKHALINVAQNNSNNAYLLDDQTYYAKQGGKMNTLLSSKNGNKIHIKKKNKGKFTSYCGGKVTGECIRRAKASGNPTLVKRATFAANARKWKHAKGGILYGSEGIDLGYDMNQGTDVGMDYETELKNNKGGML